MRIPVLLALFFAVVAAVPSNPQRIVGGSVTTINQYPSLAAVLRSYIVGIFWRECGGTILNSRSILTAAECTAFVRLVDLRIRVGSTWGDTGGVVHNVNGNIIHPSYDRRFPDYDIAILRSATTISFDNNVRVASIAGANYNLAENQAVWFAGWDSNSTPEQLRHVQLTVINQGLCRIVHAQYGLNITAGMLCAGWANGGRGQCDKGGPLFHNGVVVGVSSYGGCGWNNLYSANTRVSPYTTWIQTNA